jgi:peptidoglycan/xylan/chitin deacetylase (PgdA/CDA1 family)
MRARAAVPEPVRERLRLLLARRLEHRLRASSLVRGAAIVLHAVAPQTGDPELEIEAAVAVDGLDRAVGYLVDRYRLVRAADLPDAAAARRPGEAVPIALTFDDDLPSHTDHVRPLLERRGAVATAFVCGARAPFWWQLLQLAIDTAAVPPGGLPPVEPDVVQAALERRPRAIAQLAVAVERLEPGQREQVAARLARAVPETVPVLEPDGVAALAKAGWEIGFHTRGHHVLTAVDADVLRRELERTPEITGELPLTLAYPHGKAAAREAVAARDAGYVAAYTGCSEVFTDGTDPHLIGRLQPDTTTLGRFALQLARALSDPSPGPQ